MIRFYSVILATLYSCGSHLNYLGSSFAPTKKVDVYVEASSIKRPYTIIGKGYMQYGYMAFSPYNKSRIDKLQARAIEKAKTKGADAVLFQDYFIKREGTTFQTTTRMDTTSTGLVSVENGSVEPVIASGTNILFLKYD